ncbi:putative glutaredoxin [Leishmania mexicana MHOM/GT/2001/U1103]|uniref:Glutaredoxin_-_putative n=4 Tax=Leishmania TaxID=38568 RepID=A0A6L0XCZ4_LEIIN|nr:putative glutaredoxin [Leishmania infantum JPCM5]XP_003860444.1 glutaredoxin, putative [Leishmania donovani]XP_003875163.1 putative glutaredoxin [Leishmania mexicana MHOM/GT/2001/U1103]CAC9484518.1 glutaredoxin_-_putative [Leishmania infantum]AYU78381.1 glutaredoxin, putative [Leishmania donovani]TPP45481.1 Glutaredoxin family protein [Leishmania donovani]TPP49903.1 Glutaredoxin family protein [Leishmania donovani]CAJ1988391.1 glutaredoxin [Leishmania donovani]|eukprot:XP_001465233.1 putative glutaredoxin [Leishmania infantum JPCM5]
MNQALDPARAPQFLDSMLRRNRIVLISATYCQFSTKLKMLLIELKHRFVSLEIDIIPNGREVFQEVVARTGVHTVPQVFLNGKYLGGYDDLIALYHKRELSETLEKR